MVVLEDRISEWETKGEILDGYFNPAGAFDRVTVLGLVGDRPADETIARLSGPAGHRYVNAGLDRRSLFLRTLGLRPGRLAGILGQLSDNVAEDPPQVLRAYGDGLAAVAAAAIGRRLQIPHAVSLHTTPDPEVQARHLGARDRLWRRLLVPAVLQSLRDAGAVMAVYAPIRDHLPPDIAARTVVVPNAVGIPSPPAFRTHDGGPLRALWLGRQMPGRDPRPVIRALETTPNTTLTLIGDGPLRAAAQRLAAERGLAARTKFIPALENRELCARLPDHDVLVVHSDFREMPKTVMEAALSGLPVVVNRLPAAQSPEYGDIPAVLVDAEPGAYAAALRDLEGNTPKREALARETQDAAWKAWNPGRVAEQAADLLRGLAAGQG